MSVLRSALVGAAAGAVGTAALNITTYADMASRGRPSSETPAKLVQNVAASAGIEPLAAEGETAKNRRSGVGALLGYLNGLGLGAVYGALRPASRVRRPGARQAGPRISFRTQCTGSRWRSRSTRWMRARRAVPEPHGAGAQAYSL
jgi:hypothetical protein